jgi:cyclase
MSNVRLIARLDIKGPNLIKGVQLEGLRVVGDPQEYARRYYEQGADELLYIDIVASLYGRSKLTEIVRKAAHDVFVPMTVGGGIRTVDDVTDLLRAGADKVAINTAAVHRPDLISEVARRFGSQCMVLSIEAKQQSPGHWEVYTDCGRERSGVSAIEWARRGVELGAGEILVTSIDMEGTRKGSEPLRQPPRFRSLPAAAMEILLICARLSMSVRTRSHLQTLCIMRAPRFPIFVRRLGNSAFRREWHVEFQGNSSRLRCGQSVQRASRARTFRGNAGPRQQRSCGHREC